MVGCSELTRSVFRLLPECQKVLEKPDKQALVGEAFKDTVINVTVKEQKHFGAVIGSRDFLENYVSEKVDNSGSAK